MYLVWIVVVMCLASGSSSAGRRYNCSCHVCPFFSQPGTKMSSEGKVCCGRSCDGRVDEVEVVVCDRSCLHLLIQLQVGTANVPRKYANRCVNGTHPSGTCTRFCSRTLWRHAVSRSQKNRCVSSRDSLPIASCGEARKVLGTVLLCSKDSHHVTRKSPKTHRFPLAAGALYRKVPGGDASVKPSGQASFVVPSFEVKRSEYSPGSFPHKDQGLFKSRADVGFFLDE